MPLVLSLILTPIIRVIAVKNGLVSYPRADRWHKKPTAILGGISIYLASIIPLILINIDNKNMRGLFIGGTFLFIIGLADDKLHLPPYAKLFTQIIAACIAVFSGITINLPLNIAVSIPLTLLWIVGITNAFNLLDNIDGLAAGIAVISSLMLFYCSLNFSNNPLSIFALILAGASLGFLPYNFNPAKIFMGDSGSMFLGYSLAVVSIGGTIRHISNFLIIMLIPIFILSIPIFDTIFVIIGRTFQGKRIFEGGKDHTSHRLVTLGLSQRKTVLLLYILSMVFGIIAISYSRLNMFIISVIAFLSLVVFLFFGFFLFEVTSPHNKHKLNQKLKSENSIIMNSILMHKRRIVEVLLDLVFICIANYSAYFLRFEGRLLTGNLALIKESLVWIILIKMSCFFMFGLYRGVWRYISISDLLTIFKVVTFGSVACVLFLTFVFRFQEYSRAVFFIDWILLLFLISGTRIIFRVLGEFFSRAREKGNNVLIFGAGDTGEMVMREIKRNKALNYNPIGFIDDDLSKIGNKIQGIPVLGSRVKIKPLVRMQNIKEILVAIPSIDIADFAEIAKICHDCGIAYRKIKGILDREDMLDFEGN
jgi:UDP-GlcNAc:undecaprenyl-phosphate/decaprenyl-phosphate GlcNAc-1-phosphate transferase